MSSPVKYKQVIQPLWNVVQQVRDEVGIIVKGRGEELCYAAQMAASELVENAVKYGAAIDPEENRGIEFLLDIDDNDIQIIVINGVATQKDIDNVSVHLDAIKESDDPQALYIQRLTELMDKPGQGGSQLGLYRIAYEGAFDLDYEISDRVLSVKAHRKIAKQ